LQIAKLAYMLEFSYIKTKIGSLMMNLKRTFKLGQGGFGHVEAVVVVAVIAVVGVAGVYVSRHNNTHAATPSTVQSAVVYDGAATAQGQNPNVTVINSTVNNLGSVNVVELNPGQTAGFGPYKGGGGWYPVSDCYSMDTLSSSVNAVITSGSSSEGVKVPENSNYYSTYCIDHSKVTTSNPAPGYSVKNRFDSSGPLYIYQDATNEECSVSC
jgi:hypothetical protein